MVDELSGLKTAREREFYFSLSSSEGSLFLVYFWAADGGKGCGPQASLCLTERQRDRETVCVCVCVRLTPGSSVFVI